MPHLFCVFPEIVHGNVDNPTACLCRPAGWGRSLESSTRRRHTLGTDHEDPHPHKKITPSGKNITESRPDALRVRLHLQVAQAVDSPRAPDTIAESA